MANRKDSNVTDAVLLADILEMDAAWLDQMLYGESMIVDGLLITRQENGYTTEKIKG